MHVWLGCMYQSLGYLCWENVECVALTSFPGTTTRLAQGTSSDALSSFSVAWFVNLM